MSQRNDPVRTERELAWTGDAVLSLFAREWILRHHGRLDSALFAALTCNSFLSALGNPTRVEAGIGALYREQGLEAATRWMQEHLVPLFEKQQRNRDRVERGKMEK